MIVYLVSFLSAILLYKLIDRIAFFEKIVYNSQNSKPKNAVFTRSSAFLLGI